MVLDLQSLFGLHVTSCVHLYSLAEMRSRNTPPPAFGLVNEGAIGQPRSTTSLYDPLDENVRVGIKVVSCLVGRYLTVRIAQRLGQLTQVHLKRGNAH
jgi:hypothetical protein